MAIFSVLLLLFSYWWVNPLESSIKALSFPAQIFCKDLLDLPSPHLVFYQAIACGASIETQTYDALRTVSLWHLVIVSAGHFRVIEAVLKFLPTRLSFLHLWILSGFCLWTGAQPPVLRSFTELLLQKLSRSLKLSIPAAYLTLYCGCLLLLLFPNWCRSWSFLLSWLCAILIQLLFKQSLLISSLGMSVLLMPIMAFFSPQHPLGFLFNLILGPPMALFLFPACCLMIIFPWLHLLCDPILEALLVILEQLVAVPLVAAPDVNFTHSDFLKVGWAYLLVLQAFLIIQVRRSHA